MFMQYHFLCFINRYKNLIYIFNYSTSTTLFLPKLCSNNMYHKEHEHVLTSTTINIDEYRE